MAIEVLIVDDRAVVREGLKVLLGAADGVSVIGDVGTAASALDAVAVCPPDVLLLGLDLGAEDGLSILQRLPALSPETRTLVLAGFPEHGRHAAAVLAGARGLVGRDRPPEVLLEAIRKVHAGETWFDPDLLDSTPRRALGAAQRPPDPDAKTVDCPGEREREIVGLVAEGLGDAGTGARLGIERTVRNRSG